MAKSFSGIVINHSRFPTKSRGDGTHLPAGLSDRLRRSSVWNHYKAEGKKMQRLMGILCRLRGK
jgi:hypothetical protein